MREERSPGSGSTRAETTITARLPRTQVVPTLAAADFTRREQSIITVQDQVVLVETQVIPVIERRYVTLGADRRDEVERALENWREARAELDRALAKARTATSADWAETRAELAVSYERYDTATIELVQVARKKGIELEVDGFTTLVE